MDTEMEIEQMKKVMAEARAQNKGRDMAQKIGYNSDSEGEKKVTLEEGKTNDESQLRMVMTEARKIKLEGGTGVADLGNENKNPQKMSPTSKSEEENETMLSTGELMQQVMVASKGMKKKDVTDVGAKDQTREKKKFMGVSVPEKRNLQWKEVEESPKKKEKLQMSGTDCVSMYFGLLVHPKAELEDEMQKVLANSPGNRQLTGFAAVDAVMEKNKKKHLAQILKDHSFSQEEYDTARSNLVMDE